MDPRRSDFDVTNTVRVSSPAAVLKAVSQVLVSANPAVNMRPVEQSFRDFEAMFDGRMPGFAGVDTVYHDLQHTLDVTLAMARLLAGYERQVESLWQMGAERMVAGVVLALFHDVGYLRRDSDQVQRNGAEFTRTHVSRGVRFLREYLPGIGLRAWTEIAAEVLHFTGYEKPFADIQLTDARDLRLGHLLGTADMIAQMSDRCYLEKCRDRLYPEFVLGGVALPLDANGTAPIRYASGLDLLRQTPKFVQYTREERLDGAFNKSYRYLEILFDGQNPYMEAIERHMQYLEQVLRSESWRMLRRNPPLHAANPEVMSEVRGLMLGYFKRAWMRD